MGFEYKEELKELLPDYMELLEEQGKTENRGNGYWTCPFCDSGNKQHNTAAFHIDGTRFNCFSCNVNNLTQSTTTYSVSFNWHGIPCAFLYS